MSEIEKIIEKAYKNDKKILLSDILNLNLSEQQYNQLMKILNQKQIQISDKDEFEHIDYFTSDSLKQYCNEVSKISLLSVEQEKELFREYSSTCSVEIREKILCSNLRLVISIARQYKTKNRGVGVDLLDLIQEGNEGLMVAVERFNVELGYKFSTYATYWIQQRMQKYVNCNSRSIRVSYPTIEWYNKFRKYIDTYLKTNGEKPSNLEIANTFGKDEEFVSKIMEIMDKPIYSLNDMVSANNDIAIVDTIPSDDLLIEDVLIEKEMFQLLNETMQHCLTDKEAFVISSRYGIVNNFNSCSCPKSLREVGNVLGLTKERIRQIEIKAFRKLKEMQKNYDVTTLKKI